MNRNEACRQKLIWLHEVIYFLNLADFSKYLLSTAFVFALGAIFFPLKQECLVSDRHLQQVF